MGKALLVIDMPKDCLHCSLRKVLHIDGKCYQHCGLDTNGYCLESFFKEDDLKDGFRSGHCPLRPMPEKMQVCGKYPQPDGIVPSYKLGYNACIDAIIGGKANE